MPEKKNMKSLYCYRLSVLLTLLSLSLGSLGAKEIGYRNQGSAPALSGKIYVLTCYVSETGWSDQEVDSITDLILEAEDWLVEQAGNYGKDVTFVNGTEGLDTPLLYDHIVSGTGSGDEPVDLVSKLMPKIGFKNGLEFTKWVHNYTDCDGCMVLIVANKPGRGYSMTYNNSYDAKTYFLEGAMLYSSYSDGRPYCAASIAHEMCHLFGAEDLYATFIQTEENEARARELFPDDIMLGVSYDINEKKIDRMTAWLIGLTDEMEDWYLDLLYEND